MAETAWPWLYFTPKKKTLSYNNTVRCYHDGRNYKNNDLSFCSVIKKVALTFTILLSLLCTVTVGGAWYFSSQLLYPKDYPCNEKHYVFCESPAQLGLEYRDITLSSSDGVRIEGWFVPGEKTDTGIVLIHGRAATRHEGLRDAIALSNAGYSLLLIDLRNSGKSERTFNSMGFHERKDVHAAVDYMKHQGINKIGIVGYSMGSSTSIMAMAENPDIAAGWFDAGFSDLDTIIQERGRDDYHLPATAVFSKLVRAFYDWRGDLDSSHSPLKVIASISPRPIMLVHGTADTVVKVSHGQALFEAAQEPKQYWEIPGGKHTQTWQADKEKSARLLQEFFQSAFE